MFTDFLVLVVVFFICVLVHQLKILIPINNFLKRASAAIDLCILVNYIGKEKLKKNCLLEDNSNIKIGVYEIDLSDNVSEKELLINVINILKDAMKYADENEKLKTSEEYEMLIFLKKEITMQLWEKYEVRPCELI